MELCLVKEGLGTAQLSVGFILKKGSGGRGWDLGSEHRSLRLAEQGSEMGDDQAVRALLVAMQRDLSAAWCEAPQGRDFPWFPLGLSWP